MSGVLILALACAASWAPPALAQDAATPDAAADATADATADADGAASEAVTTTLMAEALTPELDEAGQPVLDASGQPVLEFQPIEDSTPLLPGSEVRYVVTVAAATEVEALRMGLDLPAATLLLPGTVTASVDADFAVGSSADAAVEEPLFVEDGEARVPNPAWAAAPEGFDRLLVTIDRIAPESDATVTYHLVVR